MKKILILISLLAGCTPKPEPEEQVKGPSWDQVGAKSAVELLRNQHKEELSEWQKLILAICWTESRFDPSALGKNQDVGIMQITPIYVEEVNRVSGTNFKHEDAYSIDLSLEMFRLMNEAKNPERSINRAIYLHNKSDYYKKTVLENLDMIERMETLRSKIKKQTDNL